MLNNNLTRFDQGGTHESSPLGGIPQGQAPNGAQNLVEQGETKIGNFVHSNRISLDGDMVKAFNLPPYIKGKTIAEASKSIDDKFKDRTDKYAQETKNTLLQRLGAAQEHIKAQEQAQLAQTNAAMQANSQEVPQMDGQVPPGMEEFADQGQPAPEQGGPGLPQGDQMIAAMGGYLPRRFDNGGYIQGDANLDGIVDAKDKPQGSNAAGIAGASVGAAGSLVGLGNLAFGKSAQDTSGQAASGHVNAGSMIGGAALTGATSGAQLGNAIMPGIGGAIGAGAGAIVGGIAGGLGFGKTRDAEAENTSKFAANTNRNLSDNYAAYGGYLAKGGGLSGEDRGSDKNLYPSVDSSDFAGGGRSYPIPTQADAVDALRLAGLHGRSDVRAKVFAKYPSLKHADGGPIGPETEQDYLKSRVGEGTINSGNLNTDLANQFKSQVVDRRSPLLPGGALYSGMQTALAPTIAQQAGTVANNVSQVVGKGAKVAGRAIAENAGEALRYAPIAMNAFQLANLGKTQGVNYAQSSARFKPGYIDEAQMQRIVDQEANNQIQGLQESGASQGAVRAATLAAGLNKTKALGDAYQNAAAANRATDVQGQQFNYAVDASNIATRNKAMDEMRMDEAARRGAKSKLLGQMGTDIGNVGKEIADAQLAGALTGYTRRGKYLYKPDGTKATPAETAQAAALYNAGTATAIPKKGETYKDQYGVTHTFKMGGYLTSKPSKY